MPGTFAALNGQSPFMDPGQFLHQQNPGMNGPFQPFINRNPSDYGYTIPFNQCPIAPLILGQGFGSAPPQAHQPPMDPFFQTALEADRNNLTDSHSNPALKDYFPFIKPEDHIVINIYMNKEPLGGSAFSDPFMNFQQSQSLPIFSMQMPSSMMGQPLTSPMGQIPQIQPFSQFGQFGLGPQLSPPGPSMPHQGQFHGFSSMHPMATFNNFAPPNQTPQINGGVHTQTNPEQKPAFEPRPASNRTQNINQNSAPPHQISIDIANPNSWPSAPSNDRPAYPKPLLGRDAIDDPKKTFENKILKDQKPIPVYKAPPENYPPRPVQPTQLTQPAELAAQNDVHQIMIPNPNRNDYSQKIEKPADSMKVIPTVINPVVNIRPTLPENLKPAPEKSQPEPKSAKPVEVIKQPSGEPLRQLFNQTKTSILLGVPPESVQKQSAGLNGSTEATVAPRPVLSTLRSRQQAKFELLPPRIRQKINKKYLRESRYRAKPKYQERRVGPDPARMAENRLVLINQFKVAAPAQPLVPKHLEKVLVPITSFGDLKAEDDPKKICPVIRPNVIRSHYLEPASHLASCQEFQRSIMIVSRRISDSWHRKPAARTNVFIKIYKNTKISRREDSVWETTDYSNKRIQNLQEPEDLCVNGSEINESEDEST